jgi:hypothetical protein
MWLLELNEPGSRRTLDDAVARELAVTTRCDVNFVAARHVSGSSLRPAQRESLLAVVSDTTGSALAYSFGNLTEPCADAQS